jgi:hypothetical protein
VAAEADDAGAVVALVAAGARPDACDGGAPPVQVQAGDWTVGGRQALHLACGSGSVASVRALLRLGADPAALDACGNTPFDLAVMEAVGRGWEGAQPAAEALAALASASTAASDSCPPPPLPYGGSLQAAMAARDVKAIKLIQTARSSGGGGSRGGAALSAGIRNRLEAATIVAAAAAAATAASMAGSDAATAETAVPKACELPAAGSDALAAFKVKVKSDRVDARRAGPAQARAARAARAAGLRAILEADPDEGKSGGGGGGGGGGGSEPKRPRVRVLFAPAKGCLWDAHWYVSVGLAVKRARPASVDVVNLWRHALGEASSSPSSSAFSSTSTAGDANAAASDAVTSPALDLTFWGGWKARALVSDMGCGPASIVVGHSSGANAALRVAEKGPVAALVLHLCCIVIFKKKKRMSKQTTLSRLAGSASNTGPSSRHRSMKSLLRLRPPVSSRAPCRRWCLPSPSRQVLVGAGYSEADRAADRTARASAAAAARAPHPDEVIEPWDFGALARHCPLVVVLAGDDDDVIPPAEGWALAAGIAAAAVPEAAAAAVSTGGGCRSNSGGADAGASGGGGAGAAAAATSPLVPCRVECVRVAGGGHFMDKESPEVLAAVDGVLRRLLGDGKK